MERYFPCESPMRQGSYRGIAATTNNFARECFIDELAVAARADPRKFRRENLDDDRLKCALDAACERFAWTECKERRGFGRGLAVYVIAMTAAVCVTNSISNSFVHRTSPGWYYWCLCGLMFAQWASLRAREQSEPGTLKPVEQAAS